MAAYQQGDRGEAIRIIQRALEAAGFSPGPIDGVFGPRTAAAIRAAQAAKGLPQSGVADHATQNAIGIGTPSDGGGGGGVTDQIAARLRSQYPQLAWALNVPDLAPIIARMDQMEPAEFQAAIFNSTWYKTNQSSIREAEAQRNVDPASYDSRINETATHITNLAGTMGVHFPDVRPLAEQALRLNWSEEQIRTAIAAAAGPYVGPGGAGEIQSTEHQIVAAARNTWGVPMSDQTAREWAKRIAAGSASLEGVNAMLADQARLLYPAIAKQIEGGVTVGQYFNSYREIAAQELGINPADITISDPKWNKAIIGYDEGGQRTPYSFEQWTRELRTNPTYGWDATPAARNQAAEFASRTLQRLGVMA